VPRFFSVVVLISGCWMLAAPARASNTCDGVGTLRNAAHAYRHLGALFDIARYTVQVPGAPPHLETTEFGFDSRRRAFLRMPGLYVMAVQGNRLVLAADPANTAERVLDRPAGADLQATVDAAFDGHGAPLVPVPLLLRAARGAQDEAQAFRSRLLHRLNVRACRRVADTHGHQLVELTLEADNGVIRAGFDPASAFLLRYHAQISTTPGSAPVVADVSFEPHPGALLTDFMAGDARSVERVQHFSELAGAQTDGPPEPLHQIGLQSLDGRLFALNRFVGDVTILEFWARWCAPCRLTLPAVARLAAWAKAGHLPVHVVLVNTAEGFESVDAARPEVEGFLRWARVSLPTTLDLDGSFHRRFGGGLPLTVVISPQDQVVGRHGGFDATLEKSLRREVTELLRARGRGARHAQPTVSAGPALGRAP
jgi:thiol-disulfide isomerase/thioredoxin